MTVLPADAYLSRVWPLAWPLLEPAMKRSPDRIDLLHALRAHDAQLWLIGESGALVAAIVTMLKEHEGNLRCLWWLIGGARPREWGADAVRVIGDWAREQGCSEMYGIGRKGWARIVPAFGFTWNGDGANGSEWRRAL